MAHWYTIFFPGRPALYETGVSAIQLLGWMGVATAIVLLALYGRFILRYLLMMFYRIFLQGSK